MVAYPPSLTARIYNDYTFGVWQHAEGSPLNAQSVLYSVIYLHERLPTSSLRRTCYCPSRLDFHPYTQLVRAICRSQRCDPPPNFHRASIWPGIDRRASGLPPLTPSEHTSSLTVNCCGLVGFPSAARINRLTSPMIKTPWGIFLNARQDAAHIIAFTPCQPVPTGFTFFSHPAKDTFQLSLTLLVNYRSRVVC